ncbi:uncharacterized protein LOC135492155 isoform X2 [Lineus longissimus]
MDAISKHVNGMIHAAEKARRTFSEVKRKMEACYEGLQCSVEEKNLHNRFQQMQSDVKQVLKRDCFVCEESKRSNTRSKAVETFLSELNELRHDHQRNLNNSVAKESLGLALKKIEHAEVPLREAENLARTWYVECRNVVEQTMKENIAETKKMAAEEKRKFWEKLPFVQQAFEFLCRWKALYLLCSRHLTYIHHVRQKADSLYMENLLPREAVEKAWELVAESVDLSHIKRFPVVAKQDRTPTIGDRRYSLDHLLEVETIDEAVTTSVGKNTFGANSYALILARMQKLRRYLDVLCYLQPEMPSELQNIQSSFNKICRLIVDIFHAFENDAVDLLLSLHIVCNCWIRGLHSFVLRELQPRILGFAQVQALANEVSIFFPSNGEPLSEVLKKACRETRVTDKAKTFGLGWYIMNHFKPASHELESRKRLAMALEVVTLINKCLPLGDVVTEYLAVGRKAIGTIGEIMPPGTTDDVAHSDWMYEVIKCYKWIQAFRVLCREEVTGSKFFRDQQQMTRAKRTWRDCVQAITQLDDKMLTELVVDVEARVGEDLEGEAWREFDIGK